MRKKISSNSPEETHQIAKAFLKMILSQVKSIPRQALVISLEGNLGSGKTEFLKGVAQATKMKTKIFSPTFVIMKRFPINHKFIKFLWHLDCYRLKNINDLQELGFTDIVNNPQNIVFIEWGNKIKRFLPKNHWMIKFKIKGENERLLELEIP